ncbi:MAG: DUF624 domain-containing protein [Candidatus Spyradocola sp.]
MFDQFLSNESRFGRLMTRLGILMAANLMFLISCIPVVTAGAGLCALHHTLLKTLRGDGEINPFVEFWMGFRRNFRQATAAFLLLLLLAMLLALEIFWCSQFTGPVAAFRYGLYAIAMAALVLSLYLFPTMAAFRAPLPRLLANSFAFAMKSPLTALCVVATSVVPVVLTLAGGRYQPLFAFIWCMIGASGLAMLHASMLLRLYLPYLPRVDVCGDIISEGMEEEFITEEQDARNDRATLEDMLKLGM